MWEIIVETLIDSIKMLPFLFIAYYIIEYIEHKSSDKFNNAISRVGRFGPIVGALIGCFPQCGFSAAGANLYAGRIISLGTLIAIFISTSDEAIPVLLASPNSFGVIIKIIAIKIVIATIAGLIIDFILNYQNKDIQNLKKEKIEATKHICSDCGCDHNSIFKSALNHTVNIFVFILFLTLIMNIIIELIGEQRLSMFLLSNSILQPAIAGIIGFIPNCAASVILTKLYLGGTISLGSIVSGLCTGAGAGILVLFKVNQNLKENLKIMLILYIIGVTVGTVIQIVG